MKTKLKSIGNASVMVCDEGGRHFVKAVKKMNATMNRIPADKLFSLFTADIIEEPRIFVR